MSKEVDDFLFPSAPSTPAAQQAAPAMQVAPLAPQAAPAKKAEAAPPPAAPKAPAAIAPPSINPRSVAMPSMEEIVPQVTAAASAAKAQAPKIEVQSPIRSLVDEVSENWKPLALGAATVIAAQVARSALSNRSVRRTTPSNNPPGGTGSNNMPPSAASGPLGPLEPEVSNSATKAGPLFATPEETAAQDAEVRSRNVQAQQRLDEFERLWAARNAPAAPQVAAEPPVLTQEVPAIVEEAPRTAVAVASEQPGSQVAEAVVKDELVKPAETPKAAGAVEPPMRTGSGQPAFPGGGAERARMPKGGTFASAAEVPASMAFVPGAQYYDSLANAIRSRPAAQALVQQYGRYPASDLEARQWAGEFLKSTGAPTREAMLAAGTKPDQVSGIFQAIGANKKKLVQVGGIGGALVALHNVANAKTVGERREAVADIAGAILPPQVQAGLMALTGTQIAPGTLSPEMLARQEEANLLGSPYAFTEFAKAKRQGEKAGAGRGFVNPR